MADIHLQPNEVDEGFVAKTNWLAIAASVVVGMFIGFLWYGMLFQNQWMAGNGFTMEGDKMFKNGAEIPISSTPMIVNTVAMLVYALISARKNCVCSFSFSRSFFLPFPKSIVRILGPARSR